MKKLLLLCIVICGCSTPTPITQLEDYEIYLRPPSKKEITSLHQNNDFWKQKVKSDSTQTIYLSKLAVSEGKLFEAFGTIENILEANKALEKAVKITDSSQVGLLHQLVQNYIQQHRFKDCIPLLDKAESIGYKSKTTQQLLFDIYLELGKDKTAEIYLERLKNYKDFNYLIRAAKLEDAKGNLNEAISRLELARKQAEFSKDKALLLWSYSNLGDFYGHQGALEKSYQSFLSTLKVQPSNNYALKGIAWLAFSNEKNTEVAHRILDTLINRSNKPEYYLFRSKIAYFDKDYTTAKAYEGNFISKVIKPVYGNMYNSHLLEIYLNSTDTSYHKKALILAKKELTAVRKTAMAYSWYARALMVNDQKDKAYSIIKTHVINKTEEPKALFNAAIVLKTNTNDNTIVAELKNELMNAFYELGPNYIKPIKAL